DALRIRQLGAPNVQVTGSIKFDVVPPEEMLVRGAALRARFGARPVLACANTRDGEEALILSELAQLDIPDALLLIVPRHPQRFDEVAQLVAEHGLKLARRSSSGEEVLAPDVRVFLGDTMGEMFAYYAAADVAFVGGSLLPLGGQNLIEACAVGTPVLVGPHTFNFADAAQNAIEAGAALRVADASELMQQVSRLLSDAQIRNDMGQHAQQFAQQHRGATARTMALLAPFVNK
ncbi:MAG TPA: glycosyltransferase, partial [Oxalicibacterium sp.]